MNKIWYKKIFESADQVYDIRFFYSMHSIYWWKSFYLQWIFFLFFVFSMNLCKSLTVGSKRLLALLNGYIFLFDD